MDVRQCWKDFTTTKCQHCSRQLNKPRTLPCLHSFCLACLENFLDTYGGQLQGEIKCPICMSLFQVPEAFEFEDLPIPFLSGRFKDSLVGRRIPGDVKCSNCESGHSAVSYCYASVCRDYLCLGCDQAHQRLRSSRGHRSILLENAKSMLQKLAMCSEEYHEEEPLRYYCQQCLKCICQICYEERHRRHCVEGVQNAARQDKQKLNEALVQTEQEIAALNDKIKESWELFETRKEEISAARRLVEAYVNVAILSLEKHKKAVLAELDDFHTQLQQGHATKQEKLDLLVKQLKSPLKYGRCILKRNFDVEILKERQAVINRCSDLLISRRGWESFQFPCVKYIADKEASFKNVRHLRPGRVVVSNTGPFGSPSSARVSIPHVYQRAFQLEFDDSIDESYSSPCGVAICKASGNIAVTDRRRRRVTLFSPDGNYLRHFGDLRDSSKNLISPSSVAFTLSGEIIVVDCRNLILCSNRGLFQSYIANVARPKTVSVSKEGNLIVCDKKDAKVKVLSPYASDLLKSLPNDPVLKSCSPSFAICHGGQFFVSYQKRHCVKVFSENGDFLYNIGAKGCEKERLDAPMGLAIDWFNNLVVCDSRKGRLQVYKLDGTHVVTIEGQSSKLVSPQFVAVSKDGHLFVTDAGKREQWLRKEGVVHVFY